MAEIKPKNIIVKMPNWLGDAVMATPVLKDLRNRFPDAKITAMSISSIGLLLKENPNVDEFYVYSKPSGWLHRIEHSAVINTLKLGEYDLGLLLTNSFSSAWWFWRGGVRNRIGYAAHGRSFLLKYPVPLPKDLEKKHLVITYKELLAPLNIPVSETAPELFVTKEELQAVDLLLERNGKNANKKIIGVNPGAAYGSAKCWLPDRFKIVTEMLLREPDTMIVYFGDQSGLQLVNDICVAFADRVLNLAGKTTIRELMALIARCDAFLTNDSGPMHIAAALGTPLVALFGSTNPNKTGPFGHGPMEVICKHVDCAPCYKRVCPVDFRCMKQIGAEDVYEAVLRVMKANAGNHRATDV